MNETKKTIYFAAAAVVLALVAFIMAPKRLTPDAFLDQGEAFFTEFTDPNEANTLEVITFDESTGSARQRHANSASRSINDRKYGDPANTAVRNFCSGSLSASNPHRTPLADVRSLRKSGEPPSGSSGDMRKSQDAIVSFILRS